MECNIVKDAIFLTHSEMLYFLCIFTKEECSQKYIFYKEIYMKYLISNNKAYIILILICPNTFSSESWYLDPIQFIIDIIILIRSITFS